MIRLFSSLSLFRWKNTNAKHKLPSLTSLFFFSNETKCHCEYSNTKSGRNSKKNWNQNIVLMQSCDNHNSNGLRKSGESEEGREWDDEKMKWEFKNVIHFKCYTTLDTPSAFAYKHLRARCFPIHMHSNSVAETVSQSSWTLWSELSPNRCRELRIYISPSFMNLPYYY